MPYVSIFYYDGVYFLHLEFEPSGSAVLVPIPQASKIKVVSYMLRSKDHVLHQIKKIIYEAVFTREKRMFCSQKASGPICLISHLFVVF